MTRLPWAIASIAAVATFPAVGADWRMTPSIASGVDYTNNPRLSIGSDGSYVAVRADASADLSYRSEVTTINLVPKFVYAEHPDDPLLDRRDAYVTLAARRLYETVAWSGSMSYADDTTITSEFGFTGLQDVNRAHEAFDVSVGPTWMAGERLQFGAQAGWNDTTYEDPARTGLTDYTYASFGFSVTYVMTETLSGGIQTHIGELAIPLGSREDRDIDASLSVDWQVSDLWRLQLAYGPTRVETYYGDSQGRIYSASAARGNLRSNFRISGARDVAPTGRGVLVTRDNVSVGFDYAISPRTTWNVSVEGVRTSDAVALSGVPERTTEFMSLESTVRWRVSEQWSVVLGAGARRVNYNYRGDHAESFRVGLGLTWNGMPRAMSR